MNKGKIFLWQHTEHQFLYADLCGAVADTHTDIETQSRGRCAPRPSKEGHHSSTWGQRDGTGILLDIFYRCS